MSNKRDNIDLIVSASELTSVFDRKSSLSNLLQDIVEMVADHMNADVCSIYLFDELNSELVLKATVGLSPLSIDRVKLKPGEGITGLSLKELRPIREARAAGNPSYKYFENIDEDQYEAFLAVPIKKGLNRIGVITLQHKKADYFTKRDTAALKAIASQLAVSIANSQLLMNIGFRSTTDEKCGSLTIRGTGEGLAPVSAKAFYLNRRSNEADIDYENLASEEQLEGCMDPDDEESDCLELDSAAFEKALELSMSQLEDLQNNVDDSLSDVASMIFTAHFLMLRDENYTGEMRLLIESGKKPDEAVRQVTSHYVEVFTDSNLPGIQEKVQDVRDLEHRLLANLYGENIESADYSSNIVIAENIFPSELVKIWLQKARGVILFGSGVTAHISILARSLSIPLLATADKKVLSIPDGAEIILDPGSGIVYINPADEISERYKNVFSQEISIEEGSIPEKAVTVDGTGISIQANINIIHDVQISREFKADGIGLYRSEFPFIIRNQFPSEEEQFRIYRKILELNGDRDCIFRTLDIGGDKLPGYSSQLIEANPFLGFRGIRFSLGHPDVFQEQLRAMLRAAFDRELKIMFPMVSSLDEFYRAKQMISEAIDFLEADETPHNSSPLVGTMVELPAAVEIISDLAAEADFMSIGTNDLIMYTLAVDRTNERVRNLYKPWHPAILRSLKKIADAAAAHNTELSVCGEAAADNDVFRFLLGLGIRSFSVDPLKVPAMKEFASGLKAKDCEKFSSDVLAVNTLEKAEMFFR